MRRFSLREFEERAQGGHRLPDDPQDAAAILGPDDGNSHGDQVEDQEERGNYSSNLRSGDELADEHAEPGLIPNYLTTPDQAEEKIAMLLETQRRRNFLRNQFQQRNFQANREAMLEGEKADAQYNFKY